MPRGRHTATRFPLAVFVVLCVAVASCLAGSRAAPFASVRQTRAQGSDVAVPAPAAAPLPEPSPSSGPFMDPPGTPTPTATTHPEPAADRDMDTSRESSIAH